MSARVSARTKAANAKAFEAKRADTYQRDKARAHSVVTWGAFEVFVFYAAAHTYVAHTWPENKAREVKAPATWRARAYVGTRMAYRNRDLNSPTKAKALAVLRQSMRLEMDRIPTRLDFLEAEYTRLVEGLRS